MKFAHTFLMEMLGRKTEGRNLPLLRMVGVPIPLLLLLYAYRKRRGMSDTRAMMAH